MVKLAVSSQVEEIKQKLDIVSVISHRLPLKKRGRHFLTNCPFHHEKTPSFIVSPELQIFKCFGCGKAGDIYNFIEEFERVDFAESLEILAKEAGITLEKSFQASALTSRRSRLLLLNQEINRFYHYLLTSHPLGKSTLDYVLGRGINLSTVKLFRLGFSPPNSQLLLKHLVQKKFTENEILASGVIGKSQYQNSFYDRFSTRLIFPLCDQRGQILGFSGRALPNPSLPADRQAKYINSPETDLYHKSQTVFGLHLAKDSIKKQDSVIITEGEFDMISPFQSGVTNIVALKGTAFTTDQLNLLHRYTNNLILALDSDFAGSAAAAKSIELADSLDFDIQVLDLGDKYKDPDEAVQKDFDFFKKALSHPIPIWDFFINSAVKNYGIDTVSGKRQVLKNTLPYLAKINNSVIRSDYLKKLADIINSSFESVAEEASKITKPTAPIPATPPVPPALPLVEKLEEYLLSLIFSAQKPDKVAQKFREDLSQFTLPRFKNLTVGLLAIVDFDPSSFADNLPAETKPLFHHLYLTGTGFNFDSRTRQKEIIEAFRQLKIIRLKKQLNELGLKISRREMTDTSSSPLETEYNQLLSELSKLQLEKT